MLPEVQIVKHDLAAGARRRHETSASASATSETLALCRIGKQYAVREEQRPKEGGLQVIHRLHKRSARSHR